MGAVAEVVEVGRVGEIVHLEDKSKKHQHPHQHLEPKIHLLQSLHQHAEPTMHSTVPLAKLDAITQYCDSHHIAAFR